ncbi:hypothetical protein MHU86_23919 [Fragilaria crotonensis]|nr:hypothetical protein MHU86_23919 [Fragilaria crotonensis]
MSTETAALPSPPTAKSSLCDFMDDSCAGASPLSATVDAEGYVSPQPFVNMRSSNLTTMISSFKSSLKSRNRYTRFDATNTASISPISMSSREKQEIESTFLQFDLGPGVPLDQDGTSCHSSRLEVYQDDVVDVSMDETCSTTESSPIGFIVISPLPGAGESQSLIGHSVVSVVQSNHGTTTIFDIQENHSTLIRDMEVASHATSPNASPSRRLDFNDESDVLQPKRVNIQDSKNTVRYFSRSREEKAFYRRGRLLKKKKAIDSSGYASPLPDTTESDVVATMRETVTGAGNMIREEMMAKDTVSVSQERVKQSLLAFADLGTTANGDQKPPIKPISINDSWDDSSTRLKASAFTFSEAIGCICLDPTWVDHDSTRDDSHEAIELPLNEHQRNVEKRLEGNSEPNPRKSSTSTLEQNVYIATTISESTTDSSESGQSDVQYDEDLSRVTSPVGSVRGIVVCKEGSSKVLQRKRPENEAIARRYEVVNGARRWNLAQRSPTPTPPKAPQFLEMEEFPNVSSIQQPILDNESCVEPSTPPKCNRTAPTPPTATFANLKRSPSAKLKKQWSASKLKCSPISTLDI